MNDNGTAAGAPIATDSPDGQKDFVSMVIGGYLFGIPVLKVQDVLGQQRITRIPLAPPDVAGSLNLRGRIVTAVDVRIRLSLPAREKDEIAMSIVVEDGGELYSLLVDSVGEVLRLKSSAFEVSPPTVDARWREFSDGIYRLDNKLLIVLNVARLLDFGHRDAA